MGRWLVLAAAVGLLVGCQPSPAPGPAKGPVGSRTAQLRAEADRLAARGEYAAAVVKYQVALRQEPGDSSLWFALGTALSYLNRREETIEAFRRVVDLGQPESKEVELARGWLVRAGVLAPAVSFASSSAGSPGRHAAGAPREGPAGSLQGRTEWPGLLPGSRIRVTIVLLADDKGRFARHINLGEAYAFDAVPSGSYRLVARSGDTELWDQPVSIEADRETLLDLTPATSLVSPDQFPEHRPPQHENLEEKIHQWKTTS